MAVNREELVSDSEAAFRRPIELITENGFSIVRTWEINGVDAPATGPYAFVVRDPHGYELEITVRLSPDVIAQVAMRSEGRVLNDSPYWIICAESHLATYLWDNDDYPPEAILEVSQSSPDDLDLARRWKG